MSLKATLFFRGDGKILARIIQGNQTHTSRILWSISFELSNTWNDEFSIGKLVQHFQ